MRCDNKELLQPHFPNSETHASPRSAMAQMIFTSQSISPKQYCHSLTTELDMRLHAFIRSRHFRLSTHCWRVARSARFSNLPSFQFRSG